MRKMDWVIINNVPEPVVDNKKSVKESYKSDEQTNTIANTKQPVQIINNRGMLNESAVDHLVETYVPNYKDSNYLTKMGTYLDTTVMKTIF